MANNLTDNPWMIDSTGVLTTDDVPIKHLRWVGATTAGHAALINDKNGREVWKSVASGANYVEDSLSENQRFFHGLTVATLASGTLELYYW